MFKNILIIILVLALGSQLYISIVYGRGRSDDLNTALRQTVRIVEALCNGNSDRQSMLLLAKKEASRPEHVLEDQIKKRVSVDRLQMTFNDDGKLVKVNPIVRFDPYWLDLLKSSDKDEASR